MSHPILDVDEHLKALNECNATPRGTEVNSTCPTTQVNATPQGTQVTSSLYNQYGGKLETTRKGEKDKGLLILC